MALSDLSSRTVGKLVSGYGSLSLHDCILTTEVLPSAFESTVALTRIGLQKEAYDRPRHQVRTMDYFHGAAALAQASIFQYLLPLLVYVRNIRYPLPVT